MAKKKRGKLQLDLKRGALHKQLGIKEGDKIPLAKLQELKKSKNPTTRKRANFALISQTWKKGRFKRPA